jgi:hypothetical protein
MSPVQQIDMVYQLRYNVRVLSIKESDDAPDERNAARSTDHSVTKLHDGAVKCGLGVRREFLA